MSSVRNFFRHNARFVSPLVLALAAVPLILLGLVGTAFAQATGAAPGAPSPLLQMVPLVVIVGVMYFLVLRPQMKKQKEHATFVTQLKRGEEVLTTGGILGRIEGLTELYVTLEIAPNVRIRVLRTHVAANLPTTTSAAEVKT